MESGRRRIRPLASLRFALERLVLRGLKARLMIAALLIVLVAVFAGLLAAALDGGFADPAEAVWWAFLRLTDPGYLGDDEGVARAVIATVLTVLGFLLFVGLLIAILTQWLNETIRKLESGVTPVVLTNHVIVLGWTYQTVAIVETLLRTRGRVSRFLARHGVRDLRIVIMADSVDAARRADLRQELGPVWDPGRVFVRSGSPLHVDHLERVAFRDAAVVILPGAGFSERNPERVDARTIKTLASISRYASESAAPPPFAVAELFDARRVTVANRAYDGASEAIAADGIVARLIAQGVRHRGLWSVLSEIFTLNEGNAIYLNRVEGQAGTAFEDLRGRFSKAVLMGFIRPGEQKPLLDPDPQTVLDADDLPVFLARAFEDCVPDLGSRPGAAAANAAESLPLTTGGPRRVLILGWSRKVPALLRELVRFGDQAFEIDVVSRTSIEAREAGIAQAEAWQADARIRQIVASFSTPGVIDDLEPAQYDHIVILASELLEEKEHADAVTVVAALTLRATLESKSDQTQVLVELLDGENEYLFKGGGEDVMVSPMVVSYLVSQVALRRELAWVFWELTRPWGSQILLRGAADYLGMDGTVTFGTVERIAAQNGEIALGLRRPADGQAGLALNPDREAAWDLAPGDEVVILTDIEDPADGDTAA